MRRTTVAVLGVILMVVVLVQAGNGAATGTSVKLRELMTPADFSRAGLSKLTPQELAALEARLGAYTDVVAQVVRSTSSKPASAPPARSGRSPSSAADVIETCIEDDFEGWEGETIFELCNDQIWQQSEYAYMYHYAYRPEVIIYRTSSGYRMKVEDVAETIGVERIK